MFGIALIDRLGDTACMITGDAAQFANLAGTHDLRLSAWGPYTKRYMGISHIPAPARGLRFDLSVFPGLYRRRVDVPNVTWESGYHPWLAAPDLSFFRHRHEIVWKDQVYCDVDFCRLDETAVLIAATCMNTSGEPQNLVLHYMASANFPALQPNCTDPIQTYRVVLPDNATWVDGRDYSALVKPSAGPRASLVTDGHRLGEIRDHGFVEGGGLGTGFGTEQGDSATYDIVLKTDIPEATLLIRARLGDGSRLNVTVALGADHAAELVGTGDLSTYRLDVGALDVGTHALSIRSLGGAAIDVDGFVILPAGQVDDVAFEHVPWNAIPRRLDAPRDDTLVLKYDQFDTCYGIAWGWRAATIREFRCHDLDGCMRYRVHDHGSEVLHGNGDGHFTNVFMRPITMAPGTECTIYGLVCSGDETAVQKRLGAFDATDAEWLDVHRKAQSRAVTLTAKPDGQAYTFSQERMAATTLTNVVYPVRTRRTWIRHYTPGRWWDSLYTWDSGFVGLGLAELDLDRSIDNLNAYVTEPGDPDAAFIHHGSPVPVQFYQFLELWNRTQSQELLTYFYPRLQQYHRFLAGRLGSSTTRSLRSNLLKTWDYFYNSGGWDDYPPQVHVHRQHSEATVTPVVNTAHAIRTARILRMAALALGEDTAEYDADINAFMTALQAHAWDEASGYFGYVCHDDDGNAAGIMRHESGANFNMGLGGATPLVAGICTPEQEERLVRHLMSDDEIWCRCGLSTVDQSAPYYTPEGYWNGAVWMPHQWFFWKALLDLGKADEAYRIASTGLDVWKREVEDSYNCFEHFIVATGRGAGWHHFGGLSTPVLAWYGAYHRPGRLTTGLDAWIVSQVFSHDHRALTATITRHGQSRHRPVIIASMADGNHYRATWNDRDVETNERHPGTLEIRLPADTGSGTLVVTRQ